MRNLGAGAPLYPLKSITNCTRGAGIGPCLFGKVQLKIQWFHFQLLISQRLHTTRIWLKWSRIEEVIKALEKSVLMLMVGLDALHSAWLPNLHFQVTRIQIYHYYCTRSFLGTRNLDKIYAGYWIFNTAHSKSLVIWVLKERMFEGWGFFSHFLKYFMCSKNKVGC